MIAMHRDESETIQESPEATPDADNLFKVLMKASKEDQGEEGKGLSDEAISGKCGFASRNLHF